jgi:hypothetical protein
LNRGDAGRRCALMTCSRAQNIARAGLPTMASCTNIAARLIGGTSHAPCTADGCGSPAHPQTLSAGTASEGILESSSSTLGACRATAAHRLPARQTDHLVETSMKQLDWCPSPPGHDRTAGGAAGTRSASSARPVGETGPDHLASSYGPQGCAKRGRPSEPPVPGGLIIDPKLRPSSTIEG